MHEITMPKLSDSMQAGKIIEWKVREGDEVHEGDILAEVESDKAAMELECFQNGVIQKILRNDGDEVRVGEVIAIIGEEGEGEAPRKEAPKEAKPKARAPAPERKEKPAKAAPERKTPEPKEKPEAAEGMESHQTEAVKETMKSGEQFPSKSAETSPIQGERLAISPYARRLLRERGIDPSGIKGTGPGGRIISRDVEAILSGKAVQQTRGEKPAGAPTETEEKPEPRREAAKPSAAPGERPEPSKQGGDVDPRARAVAEKRGVDLSQVKGTGTGGRITVEDVLAAGARPEPAKSAAAEDDLPALDVRPEEADVQDAPFRLKTQARVVAASKRTIPHFYVTTSVEMDALLARKDELKQKHGATLTHAIMLACIRALKKHPLVNRSYDHGRIIAWKGIHLGLAIETDDGLTVAVVRNAQDLSLADLVARSRELVEKARNGKLTAEDRRHPTFTVSNLGMFQVEQFDAIINPPASMILAVSAVLPAPVVRNGKVEVGQMMKLTLSCDHRIVDGVAAAEFMRDLKGEIEKGTEEK